MFRATEGRWGSREVEITDVMLAGRRRARSRVPQRRARGHRIRLRAPLAVDDFVIGIGVFNAEGVCCFGTNTGIEDLQSERIFGKQCVAVPFQGRLDSSSCFSAAAAVEFVSVP